MHLERANSTTSMLSILHLASIFENPLGILPANFFGRVGGLGAGVAAVRAAATGRTTTQFVVFSISVWHCGDWDWDWVWDWVWYGGFLLVHPRPGKSSSCYPFYKVCSRWHYTTRELQMSATGLQQLRDQQAQQ